jgi:ParB-like chromosome segregation protein Spo0J
VRVSIQHIAIRDILPNRYRNIARYHISETKIEALIQSYDNSGFWDGSLQARPHPTKTGKYEIAFGHHRIEAAKRANLDTLGLVVAKRSDADMLRMMADENREEFKGDHLVAIETVNATIEAFGRGEIEFEPVPADTPKAHIYNVPPGGGTYTCATVARFLGWTKRHDDDAVEPTRACRLAFEAYHEKANIVDALAELPEEDRTRQATTTVLKAARVARNVARRAGKPGAEVEAAAKRAAKEAVKRIKQGDIATKVRNEAAKIGRAAARVDPTPLEISSFVRRRIDGLRARIVNLETDIDETLGEVWPYRAQLDEPAERCLLEGLRFAESRTTALFAKWQQRFARTIRDITPQQKRLKG